jgi:hypothetical protein
MADIFVAELTLIEMVDAEARRPMPNPKVFGELGYAVKARGWERIIMLSTRHTEVPKHFPIHRSGARIC